jgi:hypothetical protein
MTSITFPISPSTTDLTGTLARVYEYAPNGTLGGRVVDDVAVETATVSFDLEDGKVYAALFNKATAPEVCVYNVRVSTASSEIEDAPMDGREWARRNGFWVAVAAEDQGVPEAPDDGKLYGRQSRDWSEVVIPEPVPPAPATVALIQPMSTGTLTMFVTPNMTAYNADGTKTYATKFFYQCVDNNGGTLTHPKILAIAAMFNGGNDFEMPGWGSMRQGGSFWSRWIINKTSASIGTSSDASGLWSKTRQSHEVYFTHSTPINIDEL